MPTILFGIGAFALFAGLVMVGFGIPINEFSFGNTLISAGTTAAVGGLIIIGLGIVAGQVRRVAEALTMQPPARAGQPVEPFENAAPARSLPPQAQPGKSRSDARLDTRTDPHISAPGAPIDDRPLESLAPALRNPDQPSETVEDDISLSPHHPASPAQPAADKSRDTNWRTPVPPLPPAGSAPVRPIQNPNFDAMWPAETRSPKTSAAGEPFANVRPAAPARDAPATPKRSEPDKQRTAAILKSGIVDGMAYTLYVDGSIEAELPQGTLRFASINELRSHLAKNS